MLQKEGELLRSSGGADVDQGRAGVHARRLRAEAFDSESLANVEAGLQARSIKATLTPVVEVIVAIGTCLVLGYECGSLCPDG